MAISGGGVLTVTAKSVNQEGLEKSITIQRESVLNLPKDELDELANLMAYERTREAERRERASHEQASVAAENAY